MKKKIKIDYDGVKFNITSATLIDNGNETELEELKGLEFTVSVVITDLELQWKITDKLRSLGLAQFNKVIKEDENQIIFGTADNIHSLLRIKFDKENVPSEEKEIDVNFSDIIPAKVEVNGQTLVFKFRQPRFQPELEKSLPCVNICPYGERCSIIPDPRKPGEIDTTTFSDFCGEIGELEDDLFNAIPDEGTVEEEFKKIGIDI